MNRYRSIHVTLNIIMLGAMLFGMIAPAAEFGLMIARAQESTEEATEELLAATEMPTEAATEIPTEAPTESPIETPQDTPAPETTAVVEPEITDEPAAEVTDEPTAAPTDTPTEAPETPTAEPPATSFQDNFEADSASSWTLEPGWAITADGDNLLLRGVIPGAVATMNSINWPHLNLRASLRVQPGNRVEIHLRKADAESYRFVLDANGTTTLYRGETRLAEGDAIESDSTEATWRTLTVQAFGPYLTASLDDVLQFTYEDANPLTAGTVAFVTGTQNTGAVDVDDIAINKLEAPPAATETAPVPEVTVEVTEEATAEVTQEPEATPEVTAEPAPELVAVPVISADFESELTGWAASEGAVTVASEDGNHALLMDSGDSLIPVDALDLGDVRLDARINFVNAADGGLNYVFRSSDGSSYILMLDAAQITLSRSDAAGLTPLLSAPAARTANTWYALSAEAVGGLITVAVDGVVELTYADASALMTGGVALAATGTTSFLLDDVVLYQLIPADMLPTPTPLPVYMLTEESAAKLTDALHQTLRLYEAGDVEGSLALAESMAIKTLDEALTIEVIVWPEFSNETLAPVVELNGGVIQSVEEKNLIVQIPLPNIIALVASEEVRAVRMPDAAASASDNLAVALNTALQSTPLPHSLGMIGWNDWNTQNIKGNGVKIGVIDKSGTHRQAVVELVKALAPGATVTTYTATNVGDLDNAINSARTGGNKIILITMDLGAHVSPGDGTGSAGSNQGSADAVYQAIQTAREAGRLVIVSAGNNTNGYVSFTHTTATTIPMTLQQGPYLVSVSWNRWGASGNVPSTISGAGISSQSSPSRVDEPGYQFSGNCTQPTCNVNLSIGGNTGFYVQVQLNSPGTINGITGSTRDTTAGNIGRPADSPYALAVGAVCSRQTPYYVPMNDSSHGPIFASGGSGSGPDTITNTRRDFKPDLVSLSHVDSSLYDPVGDPDCDLPDGPTGGFTGTSAAAAHVAGMAALLLSNSSMNAKIANAPNPADALQNYLQTHTVDLFSPAADGFGTTTGSPAPTQEDYNAGFDNIYGAGLTMLGSPTYNLATVQNPLDSSGTAVFVGQGNPDTEQLGTFDKPYIHIAKAIAEAARLDRPDRIVLLPGEYVSGFAFLNRTGLSIEGYNGLATIWVNDSYNGHAGILFEGSTGITLDTLQFVAANPSDVPVFNRPSAIQFRNISGTPFDADGSIIRSSTFSGFVDGVPLSIYGAYGISIFNSIFENINVSGDQLGSAAIAIENSFTATDRVMLRGNTFRNITGTVQINTPAYESIISVTNSAVDIFSNFFLQANAEAIINLTNTANDGTNTVNIVSNMFLNNRNVVAYLNPAPQVSFVNNTVVNQSIQGILNSDIAMLLRTGLTDYSWNVHNNLFYNNGAGAPSGYRIALHKGFFSACQANLSAPAGSENGARHNWVINTQVAFSTGTCDKSFMNGTPQTPQNNNIIVNDTVDPADIFIGADPRFLLDANTDPLYYQIIETAAGIDAADPALVVEPLIDFSENTRLWDGDGDLIDEPDMGAFELVPLTAGPIDVLRVEDLFDQPNDRATAFGIDLRQGVDGGFQPYSFRIKSLPINYSTDPSDFCLGAGVRIQGNFAYYCPPPQFYTSESLAEVPDNIQFEYYAFDRASDLNDLLNAEFSTVTVKITPVQDLALTTPINYQFITEAGTNFRFRLRPWVRYNNFRFSELGTQRANQSDYPFSYNTNVTVTGIGEEGFNPNILDHGGVGIAGLESYIETQLQNPNPDGTITLVSRNGERGFIQFTYQVSDSHTPVGTITNTIRLEVVGTLPDRGLHDDSSFSFRYDNLTSNTNGWSPVTSPTAINNTLHQTKKLNDIAGFDFVGESFVLYMQAVNQGSQWQLRIDDKAGVNPPLTWVRQPDGSFMAQSDGYNCVTRAAVSNNLISNNGKLPYTVSCDNLRDGEAHSVEIINKQAKPLAVDALAILFETDPLLPGFHEVTEHDLFTTLAGWTVVNDTKASGGKALAAPSGAVDDIIFRFSGTGIALGTTLEKAKNATTGVDYDICITPQIDTVPGTEVCQNFNNGFGAGTKPIWNVFRPFYGYSYDPLAAALDIHEVRIHINNLPSGTRFIIDSLVVFGDQPTDILNADVRTVEDDVIGPVVTSNGASNSWALNTANSKASNRSLTSLVKKVIAAGPFIGFQVDEDVNLIHWYRQKGSKDSQNVLVCVDRGQGEAGITNHCLTYNLRTAPNPLIIREIDFGGWGTSWTDEDIHTVEIFSLVNEAFNFDKIEAFNSLVPLPGGLYEDFVFAASNNTFGFFDDVAGNPLNGGSFQIIQDTTAAKASGASVARTSTANEGVLFQMNGTGFSVGFTKNDKSGTVQICWVNTLTTSVTTVEAGDCRTVNNFSSTNAFKVGYTISGLAAGNYTVTVKNLQAKPMQFDFVEIFDDPLPGNLLADASTRYEPSFVNRAAEDMFLYYGKWNSVSGSKASKFSGSNYDFIQGVQGASLVFQTQNVDALRILRTVKSGFANIQVCVDGPLNCTDINATQASAVVTLPDTNLHVISIILTSAGRFELDALEVFNSTDALLPGLYEDNVPNLQYDSRWTTKTGNAYTEGHAQRTAAANAQLLFYMQGSVLELGTFVKATNQVQICFEAGIVTDPNNVNDLCQTFPSAGPFTGRRVYNSGTLPSGLATYTVRVRNLVAQELLLDYVSIIDGVSGPLSNGHFEESHPQVASGLDGAWSNVASNSASGGAYARTSTVNDFLLFQIQGTGFGIGTFIEKAGSEMEVCYIDGLVSNWDGTGGECITFQNEASKTATNITRAITGLPDDSYTIRVTNLDDGLSQLANPPTPRDSTANPPALVIDFIEAYSDLPAVMDAADAYNQDATDGGTPLMQLLPADRWGTLTANSATARSYAAVIDNADKLTGNYAGPSATFRIEVPANTTSLLILDNLSKDAKNSQQLQICIIGETSAISIECEIRTTLLTSRYQTVSIENPTGSPITRTISFSTLTPGFFRIDGFQLTQGETLGAGIYEDSVIQPGGLIDAVGTGWATVNNNKFTNGSVIQTTNADLNAVPNGSGDYVQFEFEGTGFAIGTHMGKSGSEMRVCYSPSADFDGSFFDVTVANEYCLDFQNEASATSTNVLRTVAGLPEDTYNVVVMHRSDGQTNLPNPPKARPATNPATLIIDYVLIYSAELPALLEETGLFNQDAADSGDPFIQLLPADRWSTISDKSAKNASSQNFVSVVDGTGRVDNKSAGTTAVVRVNVTSAKGATLVLNTFTSGSNHSNQLRYCILSDEVLTACNILNTMPSNPNQTVELETPGEYTIFFQTLTPGFFRIDGLHFVQGDTLIEGIYDNHFISADPNSPIRLNGTWSNRVKVKNTFGGEVQRSQTLGANLTFTFEGTGFAILNTEDKYRLRLEVCFVSEAQFLINGFTDAVCRLNSANVTSGKFEQYGLSYYGLEPDTYVARVTVDQSGIGSTTQWFQLDGIVIFGDVTAQGPIGPGIYDDAALENNPAVRFAPAPFWTANTAKSGPPKGPWQLSEHVATNSGAVMQLFVEGNTLMIYQSFTNNNSNNVSACLVVFGTIVNELQCNNISQKGKTAYFTPIAFFGLGTGQHQIIFENKTPKKRFNIDGIRVTP